MSSIIDGPDNVSLTLTIDEIRWLHASESIAIAPAEETAHSSTLNPDMSVQATTTSNSIASPLASAKEADVPSIRPRTHPSSLRAWDKHRHYHFGLGDDEDSLPTDDPLRIERLPSSSSSHSSSTTPTSRKPSSSLIPAPIPASLMGSTATIPIPIPTTIDVPTAPIRPALSRSLPTPQRTEWIYRSPRPRPRPSTAPALTLSTSTTSTIKVSPSPNTPTRPSPLRPSPIKSSPTSRLPIAVPRTHTRARSTSRASPIAISRSTSSSSTSTSKTTGPTKRPTRPQTGYGGFGNSAHSLSHANNGNAIKRPVHSSLPARIGGKKKEKGGKEAAVDVKPFWSLFDSKLGKDKATLKGDSASSSDDCYMDDDDLPEGSPGSRIMAIVNSAEAARDEEREKERAGLKDAEKKEKEKMNKLKKAKGLALAIGKGRPSEVSQKHKRSGSSGSAVSAISSSFSSTSSVDTDTLSSCSTATPYKLPGFSIASTSTLLTISSNTTTKTTTTTTTTTRTTALRSPRSSPTPPPSTPPRNRASSSSSNSSNSTAGTSLRSNSTTATTPSPSLTAKPLLPSPLPAKSILTRSASSHSSGSQRPRLATFFRGGSSNNGSAKSVTFVEEPTVHYPEPSYVDEEEEGGWFSGHSTDDGESEEELRPRHLRGRGRDKGKKGTNEHSKQGSHLDMDEDMTGIGSGMRLGLSKAALAWEMGLDVDAMEFDPLAMDTSTEVNLDAPLELDIGQRFVASERMRIGGIEEVDEDDLPEDNETQCDGEQPRGRTKSTVKRLLSLTRPATSGGATTTVNRGINKSYDKANNKTTTRPAISGPFALGSQAHPPSSFAAPPSPGTSRSASPFHSRVGRSTASLRTSSPHAISSSTRARSNSSSTSHSAYRTQYLNTYCSTRSTPSSPSLSPSISTSASTSTSSAPILAPHHHHHHHKPHTYSHPPTTMNRPRAHPITIPTSITADVSPASSSSSVVVGSPTRYTTSLRPAASLESFRSAAGRSVRSLGSIRSTASTKGFRAWLGRVGEGIGLGAVAKEDMEE